MMNSSGLKGLISTINGQRGAYPALPLIQKGPDTAALVSKLVHGDQQAQSFDIRRKNAENGLNAADIQAISDAIRARTKDNESIIQLFPDIELAIQILVSNILSPKDMVKTELIYKTREPIFRSELLAQMNDFTKVEVEAHYNFTGEQQDILRAALFDTGSYVKAVLPESIVDSMINEHRQVSVEGLVDIFDENKKIRSLGILGNSNAGVENPDKPRLALEAFFNGGSVVEFNSQVMTKDSTGKLVAMEHLEITDNFQLLKLPKVIEVGNKQKMRNLAKRFTQTARKYDVAVEAFDDGGKDKKKYTTGELSTLLYKDQSRDYQHLMVLPGEYNLPRKSVGRPLVMRLPSESVIPVFVPGDESNHIGYFLLVDAEGNPVNKDYLQNDMDGLAGLLKSQNNNQNMSSLLIDKARKNLVAANDMPTLDNITSIYSSIIENDLLERLANGIHGANVKLGDNTEIYQIMLARALKSKFTRLVYIPVAFVSYFAFKYYANGVGKSYLDDVKNLTSIRAILLFAKTMAQVKSAINVTKVAMTLDPMDPDPQKTIEMAVHEVAKMRQMYFPLGINSPVDLTDWITRAGLEFTFTNHPGVPQTSFEFSTDNFKHEIPDTQLDEDLRKQTYMAFGLTPEMVDNAFNAEYATTTVQNNILMSKRVMNLQDIHKEHASEHVRRLLRYDQHIRKGYKQILVDQKGLFEETIPEEDKTRYNEDPSKYMDDVIEMYINELMIELPRPDVTSLHTQSEAFNEYEEAVEKALEFWIGDKIVTGDISGEISGNIESMKGILKAHIMRNWMANNNYLPELADITASGEDNKPIIDVYEVNKSHIEGLIKSFLGFAKAMQPVKQAADKDLQTLGTGEGTSSTDDTGSDDGGTQDDGLGGSDDFSLPSMDMPEDGEGGTGGSGENEGQDNAPEGGEGSGGGEGGDTNEATESIAITPPAKPGNVTDNGDGIVTING